MKPTAIFAVLLAGAWAFAEPTTQPAAPPAEPKTVLVLPFEAAGPAGQEWIGRAVQQNILAELARTMDVRLLVPAPADGGHGTRPDARLSDWGLA